MAGKTIKTPMLKQMLRLHIQGVHLLRISTAVGASRNTLKRYLPQIEALQLSTESLLDMEDEQVSALLNILRSGLGNVTFGDETEAGKVLAGLDNIRGPQAYQ